METRIRRIEDRTPPIQAGQLRLRFSDQDQVARVELNDLQGLKTFARKLPVGSNPAQRAWDPEGLFLAEVVFWIPSV
jgi:hypothetical protein